MTTQAQADHILAEISTFHRRSQELRKMEQDSSPDPALDPNGAPADSGWELNTTDSILEAAQELVQQISTITTTTVRQVTFQDFPNVRLRTHHDENGAIQHSHLEIRQPGESWTSIRLNQADDPAIEWLMENLQEDHST